MNATAGGGAAAAAGANAVAAAAAAPVVAAQAATKVTLCHATGSATEPFVLIEVADAAVNAHLGNHGDVSPVNNACPGPVIPPPPGGQVTICHFTASATNPFEIITVDDNALPAHLAHGDVAAVNGACPGPLPPPVIPPPDVLPEVIVPPRVIPRQVVLTSLRERVVTVQARSVSEIVPAVRRSQETRKHTGSLPATGTDVGTTVLAGLLLVLLGAAATRGSKLHLGSTAARGRSSTGLDANERGAQPSTIERAMLRANAPPTEPPRRMS